MRRENDGKILCKDVQVAGVFLILRSRDLDGLVNSG